MRWYDRTNPLGLPPNVYHGECQYQPEGVQCFDHNRCWSCGWNPKVANRRKAEIRERLRRGE